MKVWVLSTYGINGTTYRVFSTERQVLDAFAQCSPILRWSINECEVEGLDHQQSRPRAEGKERCEVSEKTLTELIETRLDIEGIRLQDREDGPWSRMLVARIRRAEAAEAYLAWILNTSTSSALEDHKIGLRLQREHSAACEAVRKLEVSK
jgi:hypothetical protein